MKKNRILLAATALAASLAVFLGCEQPTGTDITYPSAESAVDISKAANGYGNTVSYDEDEGLLTVTSTSDYTQVAIPIENGASKAIIEYTCTAKVTFGFLAKGAANWDERIAGYDKYADDVVTEFTKLTIPVPPTAYFITVGSNGVSGNEIVIKSITLVSDTATLGNLGIGEAEDEEDTVKPSVADVTSIDLAKNGDYNNQGVVKWLASDNEWEAKKGDKVTITIVATADKTPDTANAPLKGFLVDNTQAAGWWGQVSNYVTSAVIATAETTYKFEFTISTDASSSAPAACKLALYFENVQNDTVTLTVSSFKVEVE